MVVNEHAQRPFFSIGVTTYSRHDLLRETLNSILTQDFSDFEVIVGNDFVDEVLTGEMLDITDPRIRFVNHPCNLREVGNMNSLLESATGRYFTWLFDDDLFEPGFLSTAHELLLQESFPSVLFPGYRVLQGGTSYRPAKVGPGRVERLTGQDFLKDYFSSRINLISTSGFFERENFRKTIGGVEELCDSAIGLYCEYLLLVKCAFLEKIVFINAPYVVFRAHSDSWGASNAELHKYNLGGEQLVRRCAEVLRAPLLRQNFDRNLLGICKIHLSTFCFVSIRVEAAANSFGSSAISRGLVHVFDEISRVKKTFLGEGGRMGIRLQVYFVQIIIKCIYLVLVSFFYYGRRRRSGEVLSVPNS